MKKNRFGETIFQPSDEADDMRDHLGDAPFSATLSDDPNFGWTATVADADGTEVQVHDFESEDALRTWLDKLGDDLGEVVVD